MDKENNVNTKYKDRLFNFIFGREENRKWTLSLYNAINNSNHENADDIEFNTLSDTLYMGMKNDTSFIVGDLLNLYEHQSSFNPNMPLRLMEYCGKLYSCYISENNLNKYSPRLLMLPTPKLVVFYNGLTDEPEEITLKLSDSFSPETKDLADIEVKVRMLNINYGKNNAIMQKCKPLFEYSWFIDKITNLIKKYNRIAPAVNEAISLMPDDYEIKGFITKNQAEVEGMLDTEYDEAKVMALFRKDGYDDGLADGRAEEAQNTERERARADAAEARVKELEALLKETISK